MFLCTRVCVCVCVYVCVYVAGGQCVCKRIFLSLLPDHVHLLIDGLKFPPHPVRKALRWSRHLERIKIEAKQCFRLPRLVVLHRKVQTKAMGQ